MYILNQSGDKSLTVHDKNEITYQVRHARNREGDDFYVATLTVATIIWDEPFQPLGMEFDGGIYRDKETAQLEIISLYQRLKKDPDQSFQFRPSDVRPLELINMITAFI